ncbi:N'-adenosyl(rRNA) dimethyltransferase) [Durusdinium trenchii]|uniref:rRNA adenine N(6)-methyltransferase n=1 Tax=Durusdinium trenchii TaxID=1381693 RepID=A0ABP0MDV9_9DINO
MPKVKKQNLKKKAAKGKADSRKPAGATGTSSGGLVTNKKFGQHLLRNPGIVDKILNAAELKPSDVAFEIGPGTGNLTVKLIESCKRVIACEIDPRMAAEVRKRCSGTGRTNLEVRESDVLKEKWPIFDVCLPPDLISLHLQAPGTSPGLSLCRADVPEGVRRAAHCSGGRLSVRPPRGEHEPLRQGQLRLQSRTHELHATVPSADIGWIVPRYPPIEVDFREWDGLMRICFGRKRKTLRSSFCMSYTLKTLEDNYTTWCALTGNRPDKRTMKEKVIEVLSTLKLAEKRAIKIDLDTYFKLLLEFNKRGIHFTNMNVGAKIGDSQAALPDELFMEDGDGEDEAMED